MGSGAYVTAAGVWTNASDRRLKKNIVDSNYGLNEILQLRPVNYVMKKSGDKQVGFIAQEVREVLPEVVSGKEGDLKKGETLGISYGNIVPVVVNAIKEIYQRVTGAEVEISKLKAENKELRERLERIERKLATEN